MGEVAEAVKPLQILFHLRRDIAHHFEFCERRKLFNWQPPDDALGSLRVEYDFKAELVELRDDLRRFFCQPDLNLGFAITDELGFLDVGRTRAGRELANKKCAADAAVDSIRALFGSIRRLRGRRDLG